MRDATHLTENQLARLIDGDLEPALRAKVLEHLEQCADCREEAVAITRLRTDHHSAAPRRGRIIRALAAVTAVAAGVALAVIPRRAGPATDAVSGPTRATAEAPTEIEAVSPADGAAIDPERRLVWRGKRADSYRIVLLSAEGRPLWTTEIPDTSVLLPPDLPLAPGATYFWRVDALTEGITASTGPRRFEVRDR